MEEGEGAGKHTLFIQTAGMAERASTPLSICLSDPQGRDEAVGEGTQNSAKKRVHFGTHRSRVSAHASHEALTLDSPVAHPRSPWLTLLARREVLKRHGVGEHESGLEADFGSLVLPRCSFRGTTFELISNMARSEMKTRNVCLFCCHLDTDRYKVMAQSHRILQILHL